jgi:hypothetical protein
MLNDLANVFVERCRAAYPSGSGAIQIVMPQNWLFLVVTKQRELYLRMRRGHCCKIGYGFIYSHGLVGIYNCFNTLTTESLI